MVKAYPEEFRRDVIAVARKGETSVRQVAKDFGVSESCLARWLRLADRDDGVPAAASPSVKAIEQAELRDAQKRIRLLEQENEILRRAAAYFAQCSSPTRAMIDVSAAFATAGRSSRNRPRMCRTIISSSGMSRAPRPKGSSIHASSVMPPSFREAPSSRNAP